MFWLTALGYKHLERVARTYFYAAKYVINKYMLKLKLFKTCSQNHVPCAGRPLKTAGSTIVFIASGKFALSAKYLCKSSQTDRELQEYKPLLLETMGLEDAVIGALTTLAL